MSSSLRPRVSVVVISLSALTCAAPTNVDDTAFGGVDSTQDADRGLGGDGVLSAGLYRLDNGTIFYASGQDAYCWFASWRDYLFVGGPPDLSGVTALASLPPGVRLDAPCQVPSPQAQNPTNVVCAECIRFHVTAPIAVVWPSETTASLAQPIVPDSLFTVIPFADHLIGYVADQYTWPMSSTSGVLGLNLTGLSTAPTIGPGPLGLFDECGAWIHGGEVVPGTRTVRAWYHAESGYCHGEGVGQKPVKAIAYAESPDGGLTYVKPNYPDNLVVTGPADEVAQATPVHVGGEGDFSVVRRGDFNFMFFLNAFTGQSGVAVANANLGGPGSWLKWHEGDFSEPGLGGQASNIGPILAGVSLNTALQRFVGMTYQSALGLGFQVALSADATSWTLLGAPLVPNGMTWDGGRSATGSYPFGWSFYPSIVAPDGSKNWSTMFYLYYMYIRPGDTLQTRFLVVSQVWMEVGSTPVTGANVITELERYYSPSAGKHWATSALAVPTAGAWDFAAEGRLGAVFTQGGPGLIELHECVYGTASYFVSTDPSGACEGATRLRTVGWIYSPAAPQPLGTHPIYRCYQPASDDHLVSIDSGCEGGPGVVTEGLLGYVVD